MLPNDDDPIVFLGGKDYLPFFGTLTASLRAWKVVFFNSRTEPDLPRGFELVRYRTTTRTNWHYECERDLAAGALQGSLARTAKPSSVERWRRPEPQVQCRPAVILWSQERKAV